MLNRNLRCALSLVALAMIANPVRAQDGEGNVIYVPTPQVVVDTMLSMGKVGPKDFVIDLGSGDGRIVITAAKKFGARGFGVDLDEVLLKQANEAANAQGVADRVRFFKQDLFETDLSKATVITSYLLPEINAELRPTLLRLKPGTRVIAHDYDMGGWQPDENDMLAVPEKTVGRPGFSYIYLWYVPANASGKWRIRTTAGGRRLAVDLDLSQSFQILHGTARINAHNVQIKDARVRGEDVTFSFTTGTGAAAINHHFTGRIQGDEISGTLDMRAGNKVEQTVFMAKRVALGSIHLGTIWSSSGPVL